MDLAAVMLDHRTACVAQVAAIKQAHAAAAQGDSLHAVSKAVADKAAAKRQQLEIEEIDMAAVGMTVAKASIAHAARDVLLAHVRQKLQAPFSIELSHT